MCSRYKKASAKGVARKNSFNRKKRGNGRPEPRSLEARLKRLRRKNLRRFKKVVEVMPAERRIRLGLNVKTRGEPYGAHTAY